MSTGELTTTTNDGEVALAKKPTTLKGWLSDEAFRKAVEEALPEHLKADRFLRVCITALTRVPKLAKCTQDSFFKCILDLSQYGLEPDGRRAHLIPFDNRKAGAVECQLIIDYKGLVELVKRSGNVSYVYADIVCQNDLFEADKGQIVTHKIDYSKDRGEPYAVYALCRFKDGTEQAQIMTMDEVKDIRKRSRAGSSGPWVTDFAEMAKKTVFRRLAKWLPLSAEVRDRMWAPEDDTVIDVEAARPAVLLPGQSKADHLAELLDNGGSDGVDYDYEDHAQGAPVDDSK